jgi:hypothetical protein
MADKITQANQILNDHPQLQQNPGLVTDVLNSPNPAAAATNIGHLNNGVSFQQAVQDNIATHGSENIFQSMFGGAAKVVGGSLKWMAKPLQEIQRDYKFIHSVYTRHGIVNGFMATAGIVGGGLLGAEFGPAGVVAGADIAAALERKLAGLFGTTYRDSIDDSENPDYKVSAGRDFANALSKVPGLGDLRNTDKGTGKIVSGLGDLVFDFNVDPLVVAAKARTTVQQGTLIKTLKTEEGKTVLTNKTPFRSIQSGFQNFLERNSLRTFGSTEQLDSLYQAGKNPSVLDRVFGGAGTRYVRALEDITSLMNKSIKEGGGELAVVQRYPGLQGLAKYLEKPESGVFTPDDIHSVFMKAQYDKEFMTAYSVNGASIVPNRTVIRAATSKVADKLRQWDSNDELYLRGNQANFFLPRKAEKLTIDPITNQVVNTGEVQNILPVVFRPFSGDAWKSALASKTRTFSGYLPYTIDTKTLELSNTKFDPEDPASLISVYRILRFSMSDQMAKQKATEFLRGNVGQKKDIYTGAVSEMFKAAGLPNDETFMSKIMDKAGQLVHGPLDKTSYGFGYKSGEGASVIQMNGRSTTLGMFEDQRGYFTMPDFREVKTAMRDLGTYGKLYGRIDDFAARYTDGIFKPLALLTGGFGLRIAASELIPSVFRFGSLEVAKSKIAGASQKMNYKLAKGEDSAILENAIHAVSQGTNPKEYLANAAAAVEGKNIRKTIAKGLTKLASEEDLDLAARITIATRGHMATGATFTGYGIPAEQQEFMRQLTEIASQRHKRQFLAATGQYSHFTNVDEQFDLHWFSQLAKSSDGIARKQIVADALTELKRGADVDEAWEIARLKDEARIRQVEYDPTSPNFMGKPTKEDPYASERRVMAGYNKEVESALGFSHRRVDTMRNLFTGRADGSTNIKFMKKVANGEKVGLEEIKALEEGLKPKGVAGQRYEITVGPNLQQRITNFGFEKVIDPIINNMSRQPLFFNHVKNELNSVQYAINTGKISEEEGLRIAMTRASFAMVPQIHNTAMRTQFGVLVRNYLPFYFAQEQAMRRAGALISTNPAAFRQYQLIQQGLNDPGFVEEDANGQKHLTIPVIGEFGSMVLSGAAAFGLPVVGGLPVTVTGNLESLKTVLPEFNTPGVSPFISIAANTIGSFDPTLDREIKKVVGGAGFSKSLFDQLMPNSVARTVFHAIDAKETESSFYNATIAALSAAQYHGKVPSADASPLEKQAFVDRIKNNAKSIMIMKALLGTMSPLAPAVSQEDPGLRDEFYKMLKEKSPVTGKPYTYIEALNTFLDKHGDSAISYTISRTEAAIKGSMIPYTNKAINWIEGNQDLINSKNANGAAFFIPQATDLEGDAQAIHDEVIKMHLRANKTPGDFLSSYYTAAGNNYIAQQKQGHLAQMDKLKKAGVSQAAERSNWNDFVNQYGNMNPLWWDDYSSTAKRHTADLAVNDFAELFANKTPSQVKSAYGEQASLVSDLYRDWSIHNNQVTSLRNNNAYQELINAEKDNWQKYLKQVVDKTPELNTVINSVFARLG